MEIWKDVIGYEGLYQVSNLGRIKSLKFNKIKYLSIKRTNKIGYINVVLFNNLSKKSFYIHRLIAISFIPNALNKPDVNHINGIKTDNRLCNLEWTTTKENVNHATFYGLKKDRKITYNQAIEIRESKLKQKELAKIYKIHPSTISYIKLNKTYKF